MGDDTHSTGSGFVPSTGDPEAPGEVAGPELLSTLVDTPAPKTTELDDWSQDDSIVELAPHSFDVIAGTEEHDVVETPQPLPVRRNRTRIAITLFLVTLVSATLVRVVAEQRPSTLRELVLIAWNNPPAMRPALIYALALMAILLAHEMGHYLTARRLGVEQSPPYFIPFPSIFGTLGAVIFMRRQPRDRGTLLRVAVAGPYAGMLLAIPAAAYGLANSIPIEPSAVPAGEPWLGNSILFAFLTDVFSPNGSNVVLHPLAFAGWAGMFVTALNLIPAGQLDGGHITYALLGKRHSVLGAAVVLALLGLGVFLTLESESGQIGGTVWLIWGGLLFLVGTKHPPVQREGRALLPSERLAGWGALLVFALTFIPVPVRMVPTDPIAAEEILSEEGKRDWSVEDRDFAPEEFDL